MQLWEGLFPGPQRGQDKSSPQEATAELLLCSEEEKTTVLYIEKNP